MNAYLQRWQAANQGGHNIELIRKKDQANGGDILFLVSCSEIVSRADREKYIACLVLHASDLPRGRGWSPHIWELLAGAEILTVTLLEAEDAVDSGKILKKLRIVVPKHALWDEINHILFLAEVELLEFAVRQFGAMQAEPQEETQATYYRRRTPEDSEISATKTIQEQFDLIRVCDPERYPAYFVHMGHRYKLKLEKCRES